jgi:hypothetical protein
MTLPNTWRWPAKDVFLKDPIAYLDAMYNALAAEIFEPNWRLEGTVPVLAFAASLAVAVAIDRLPAHVVVSTSWLTTTAVTAVSTTGFTVTFGTAAPGGGGTLTYVVIVPEAGPA